MKRDLKKMSACDHKKILDDNRDFYEDLTSEHFTEKEKFCGKTPTFSWKKFSFAMASVLVVVIVCCTLMFTLLPSKTDSPSGQTPDSGGSGPNGGETGSDIGPGDPSPPQGITSVPSDYQTLSAYFEYIEIPENLCQTISLYYDFPTKENLFYRIENNEDQTRCFEIDLTCAGKTFPNCDESQFTQSKIFKGYEVKYEILRDDNDFRIFEYNVNALIKLPSQTVRFNFRDISLERQPDDLFFDWLEDNITFK